LPGNHELLLTAAACATAFDAAGASAAGADAADTETHPMNAAINRENSVFSEFRLGVLVIEVLVILVLLV
jgi:hypothetical protein